MYYLSLMKHDGFNPERNLRLKLNCERWESLSTNKVNPHSWCCWYGINKQFIKKTMLENDSRLRIMKDYIDKNFDFNKQDGKYYPNSESSKDIMGNRNMNRFTNDGIKWIQNSLKIELSI